MPISEKQLAANRANSQKSTGPRTPRGKNHSAQNATSHGLYAKAAVINSPNLKENPTEFNALLAGLIEELDPEGPFERNLVDTIAHCLWRQKRSMYAETAHTNDYLKDLAPMHESHILNPLFCEPDPELAENEHAFLERLTEKAASSSLPSGRFSEDLLRYEHNNNLNLARAYRILRDTQTRRRALKTQEHLT